MTSSICGCKARLGACRTASSVSASMCSVCALGIPASLPVCSLEGVAGKILTTCGPTVMLLVPQKAADMMAA
eukprot:6051393-Pyramimonas_sp.AAC.1